MEQCVKVMARGTGFRMHLNPDRMVEAVYCC
jgi:hypothetical protein